MRSQSSLNLPEPVTATGQHNIKTAAEARALLDAPWGELEDAIAELSELRRFAVAHHGIAEAGISVALRCCRDAIHGCRDAARTLDQAVADERVGSPAWYAKHYPAVSK